jgi:Ser/Thr protein kinase RdoA (MazF antagonist)
MRPYGQRDRAGQARALRAALVQEFLAAGEPIRSARLLIHQHNTSFAVVLASGSRRFVRVTRDTERSPAELGAEMRWVSRLAQERHPVAAPIAWPNGGFVRTVESAAGVTHLVQTEWALGVVVRRPGPHHFRAIGRQMALFHTSEAQTDDIVSDRWAVDAAVGNALNEEESLAMVFEVMGDGVRDTCARAAEEYLAARDDMGPIRLIHGDMHHHNVLFDGRRPTIVDFDDCGTAPLLYDLLVPVTNIEGPGREACEAALFEGYREVAEIPGDFARHRSTLDRLRLVQMIFWVIENRDHPSFARTWESEVHEMLQMLRDSRK